MFLPAFLALHFPQVLVLFMKRIASLSQAGETIIEAGSNASCMYIIDQGLAGVWIKGKRVSELGCELDLRRAHPPQQMMARGAAGADAGGGAGGARRSGTFFGEVALVTNQKVSDPPSSLLLPLPVSLLYTHSLPR